MDKNNWHPAIFTLSVLLALCATGLKLLLTPAWFDGTLVRNHELLLAFQYTNNEQSRLLQFLIPEFLRSVLGVTLEQAYIFQRLLFMLGTFYLFYLFSLEWLKPKWAVIAILILCAIISTTHKNDLQESAPLLGLTFLAALWAVRADKRLLLSIILLVGGINNETLLYIPIVYLFFYYDEWRGRRSELFIRLVTIAGPAYVSVGFIRAMNIDRPHLGGAWHLPENLQHIHQPIILFNFLLILAILKFKDKPKFLQRSLLTAPFFILPHLFTGIIAETRQMIPMGFIIIPAALYYFKFTRTCGGGKNSD